VLIGGVGVDEIGHGAKESHGVTQARPLPADRPRSDDDLGGEWRGPKPDGGRQLRRSPRAIDPLGQVYAAGDTYRRASSGRSGPIVLIGMWLIFGGGLVPLAVNLVYALTSPGPSESEITPLRVLGVVMMLAAIVLYAAILRKVTRNYLRERSARHEGKRGEW
jgi:hypothetical protein